VVRAASDLNCVSDPVLTLTLLAGFFLVLATVRFFKTLESDFALTARTPIVAGVLVGVLIRFLEPSPALHVVMIGVLLTIAALYVRLTGDESEPSDGMLLGALLGASAAIPFAIDDDTHLLSLARCILAGAVAGFGITFAAFHVNDKLRQILLDLATALAAVGAAYLPTLLSRLGVTDRRIALSAAVTIPIVLIGTMFRQWADVRAELRHEASLGLIDDADVRSTAHPFLRLGRAGWSDASAHREFVRIANRIALRKRQQRHRPDEMARLYQLEIIKLRMQLQEMSRIDHAARAARLPSDRMPISE
jgi:hypothetical protein